MNQVALVEKYGVKVDQTLHAEVLSVTSNSLRQL
jgi:hypothetical protein